MTGNYFHCFLVDKKRDTEAEFFNGVDYFLHLLRRVFFRIVNVWLELIYFDHFHFGQFHLWLSFSHREVGRKYEEWKRPRVFLGRLHIFRTPVYCLCSMSKKENSQSQGKEQSRSPRFEFLSFFEKEL